MKKRVQQRETKKERQQLSIISLPNLILLKRLMLERRPSAFAREQHRYMKYVLLVTGEAAFKPEVKIRDDGNLGVSLGASTGAGVGISDDSSGILGKIGHALGAKLGGDAGLDLSFGPSGISAGFGGGVSAGAGVGKKHDGHEEHHHHGVGWEEHHQGTTSSNGNGAVHWGNNDGYWKEGEIIIIPVPNEGDGISGNTHWTSAGGANSGGNGDVDAGIVVFPYGDNGESAGASGGSSSVHVSEGESHNHHVDHGVIKGGGGDLGGGIVISHGDAGQWHSDKGHNNGNGHGSDHVHGGGGIIISHGGHHGDHGGSKGHEGTLKVNVTKGDGKNENGNKNIHGGGSIIISQDGHHSGHNGSKGHQESSKGNEIKGDGKKGDDNSHGGGIVISHGNAGQSSNDKVHNGKGNGNKGGGGGGISINHGKGSGKDVNVTVNVSGSHGGNQSGNSAGHGGGAGGKGSDSHEKNDGHRKNCTGILNNGKCGSNVKETLTYVQTFIRSCDAIVHFLLEVNTYFFIYARSNVICMEWNRS